MRSMFWSWLGCGRLWVFYIRKMMPRNVWRILSRGILLWWERRNLMVQQKHVAFMISCEIYACENHKKKAIPFLVSLISDLLLWCYWWWYEIYNGPDFYISIFWKIFSYQFSYYLYLFQTTQDLEYWISIIFWIPRRDNGFRWYEVPRTFSLW